MSLTDERALLTTLLQERAVLASSIPKRLQGVCDQLRLSGAVGLTIPVGKRSHYLMLKNPAQLEKRLESIAAVALNEDASARALSIQANQDSKQGSRLPYVLLNVLGSEAVSWSCAKYPEPRPLPMNEMGFAGFILKEAEDACAWQPHGAVVFVENREAWVNLSDKLPDQLRGAAVIRYEGWLSKRLLAHVKHWTQAQVWLFADFDPVGFANLKALREMGVSAKMLIPHLDDQLMRTCTNESIWNDSLGLIPGIDRWIGQARPVELALWKRLRAQGAALEHEVVVSLPGLSWEV